MNIGIIIYITYYVANKLYIHLIVFSFRFFTLKEIKNMLNQYIFILCIYNNNNNKSYLYNKIILLYYWINK